MFLQWLKSRNEQILIELVHDVAERRLDAARLVRADANHDIHPSGWILRSRNVKLRQRLGRERFVARAANDPNNFLRRRRLSVLTVIQCDGLTEGFSVRKIFYCKYVVHDHDLRRILRVMGIESAPAQQWRSHRAKIIGRDGEMGG